MSNALTSEDIQALRVIFLSSNDRLNAQRVIYLAVKKVGKHLTEEERTFLLSIRENSFWGESKLREWDGICSRIRDRLGVAV